MYRREVLASSIGLRDGAIYALKICRVLAAYLVQRMGVARSRLFEETP